MNDSNENKGSFGRSLIAWLALTCSIVFAFPVAYLLLSIFYHWMSNGKARVFIMHLFFGYPIFAAVAGGFACGACASWALDKWKDVKAGMVYGRTILAIVFLLLTFAILNQPKTDGPGTSVFLSFVALIATAYGTFAGLDRGK